jgi:hypothetical protein
MLYEILLLLLPCSLCYMKYENIGSVKVHYCINQCTKSAHFVTRKLTAEDLHFA